MSIRVMLALGFVLAGSFSEVSASWLTSFQAAKEQAAAKGRPILMNFTGSDWCPACKQIAPALRSSEFLSFAAENVVLMEVDFPRYRAQAALEQQANRALSTHYQISGYPTLLLVQANGNVIEQIPPSLKPQQLIMTLRMRLNRGGGNLRPVIGARLDRDFPPEPVEDVPVPMFAGAKTHPPQVYTNLIVRTISGKAPRRFAMINSETFSVGDSASLKLGESKVRVQCLEIGEKSVKVRVEGETAPRTLLLSDIRR